MTLLAEFDDATRRLTALERLTFAEIVYQLASIGIAPDEMRDILAVARAMSEARRAYEHLSPPQRRELERRVRAQLASSLELVETE